VGALSATESRSERGDEDSPINLEGGLNPCVGRIGEMFVPRLKGRSAPLSVVLMRGADIAR
jgi:hypothetical protein